MSYPVFFTNEVRPAILLTGLNFAVLAKVLGAVTGAAFLIGINFATSTRAGGIFLGLGTPAVLCKPPTGLFATGLT